MNVSSLQWDVNFLGLECHRGTEFGTILKSAGVRDYLESYVGGVDTTSFAFRGDGMTRSHAPTAPRPAAPHRTAPRPA